MAFNLWQTSGQGLVSDEFFRFTAYSDASADYFLRGYSGHLVVLHALLYSAFFSIFGGDAYLPFRLLEAMLLGTCGLLFFLLAGPRCGRWLALGGTFLLMCLGSAAEVVATPYGIVILLPMALGALALLTLDRLGTRGDLLATLLLCASIASLDIGLAFLPAAAAILVVQTRRLLSRRLWVVLLPAALYVAWFAWSRLTGGFPASDPVQLSNLAGLPQALLDIPAAGVSAVTGVFGASDPNLADSDFELWPGRVILLLCLAGLAWRILRARDSVDRWIIVPLALGVSYWILIGMALGGDREPTSTRYLYPSSFFLLLIAATALSGLAIPRRAAYLLVPLALAAAAPNVANYVNQADAIRVGTDVRMVGSAAQELIRAELGPEAAAGAVPGYFEGVDRYGSPAGGPARILEGDPTTRAFIDLALLKAHDITFEPRPRASPHGPCREATGSWIRLPDAGVWVTGASPVTRVQVRRFADGPTPVRAFPAGAEPVRVSPAAEQLVKPWELRTLDTATLCLASPRGA